ncbi:insulinase family protein [Candidatus Woesearchaeota archaeon]|nr:insulinase family protein [Candidatus Woesearchaeota archaeon]
MQVTHLPNGITLVLAPCPGDSLTLLASVHVGSADDGVHYGISHFLEHMVFEGTRKRSSQEISNTIERLGGYFNAATDSERTFYYIKILKKHFAVAAGILSDIICHPAFPPKMIEKERKIILSEIDMVNDEPRHYQWILLQKHLFTSAARHPTYGTREAVSRISREDLIAHHQNYYTGSNLVLVLAGDAHGALPALTRLFSSLPKRGMRRQPLLESPNAFQKAVERRKQLSQSYLALGYKTPPRNSADIYALDVIHAILGRGQSGRLFSEIRGKRGLGYDVAVHHEPGISHGVFAVNVGMDNSNIPRVLSLITKEFSRLRRITKDELQDAQTFIEGNFLIEHEDTQKWATHLSLLAHCGVLEDARPYIAKIKHVSLQDVKKAAERYLTPQYTLAIVQQD